MFAHHQICPFPEGDPDPHVTHGYVGQSDNLTLTLTLKIKYSLEIKYCLEIKYSLKLNILGN